MSFPDMSAQTSPSWDFRRGPAAARILVELGADHGVAASACLAGTGITAATLHDPETPIEAGQELAVARNLIARLGDRPGLGAEAGRRYTIGSLGIWGFALMTSPSLQDMLRLGTHYAALSFAFIRPRYEEDGREALVVLDDAEIPADVRAFFVERELAKLATLTPLVLGELARVVRFETTFAGARGAALRAALPAAAIETGCERHVLAVPRARLADPLPQADIDAARALEQQCSELLDRRRRLTGVAGRVRALLLARPGEPPDMDRVAQDLCIDQRTLRRWLAGENTSFRLLSDEVRETLAVELLTTAGLTVEEVAGRLGYHDAAGFSKAFRRWTGATPGSYRSPRPQPA